MNSVVDVLNLENPVGPPCYGSSFVIAAGWTMLVFLGYCSFCCCCCRCGLRAKGMALKVMKRNQNS
nr:hypothetical protein Iba_chr07aCG12770 [Ipomoea batatas]